MMPETGTIHKQWPRILPVIYLPWCSRQVPAFRKTEFELKHTMLLPLLQALSWPTIMPHEEEEKAIVRRLLCLCFSDTIKVTLV